MKKPTDEQKAEIQRYAAATEGAYSPYATKDCDAVRLYDGKTRADCLRPNFVIDADRIINCKFFNRCGDKTQVFSFRKNDDITRRSSHVHLVSRIARKIGRALRLNPDLIEAIAIGHDIGHTPFGHAGESILSELYYEHARKYFNHNVHSVRVLNMITDNNLTIQTLDGIMCHCGEKVDEHYAPAALPDRDMFYEMFDKCYADKNAVKLLRPATLEGCVVRLSDMIAYIGKDRQDAYWSLGMRIEYTDTVIGKYNKDIIENVTQDVISNSLNKPYISLSPDVFEALELCRRENNEKIYQLPQVREPYDNIIRPMMRKLYERFLYDVEHENRSSIIYKHYLDDNYVRHNYFDGGDEYRISTEPNDLVVDFIASMTDDYFLEAFRFLFPDDKLNDNVKYVGYFDGLTD